MDLDYIIKLGEFYYSFDKSKYSLEFTKEVDFIRQVTQEFTDLSCKFNDLSSQLCAENDTLDLLDVYKLYTFKYFELVKEIIESLPHFDECYSRIDYIFGKLMDSYSLHLFKQSYCSLYNDGDEDDGNDVESLVFHVNRLHRLVSQVERDIGNVHMFLDEIDSDSSKKYLLQMFRGFQR